MKDRELGFNPTILAIPKVKVRSEHLTIAVHTPLDSSMRVQTTYKNME